MNRWTFTSESVTEGHPDKMADQISDAVLDALLAEDATSRVACETLLTTGLVMVAGEITTNAYVDIPTLVREVVTDIGYTSSEVGFDGRTCGVSVSIGSQSPDIAQGVDTTLEVRSGSSGEDILNAQGAGDQGMMFGYACDETDDLMPMPIWLAHRLAQRLAQVRKAGVLPYLRPDGKTQVTFEYEDGRPVRLATVLISTQHKPNIDLETLLLPDLRDHVIAPIVPARFAADGYKILANPTGKFELGGPHADAGLTGRKIIVDTYGGAARHGGGAFSGKDPSKVDRSAAYAARWVAKHVVASKAALRCEIQVAYAIGVARPVSLLVETFGTAQVDPARIASAVDEVFDLRPAAIIRDLDLRRPIYRRTAAYGHFGRNEKEFSWEQLSRLEELKSALGVSDKVRGAAGARDARGASLPPPGALVARVLTEVAGIDKEFDYLVPPHLTEQVSVGSEVRVDLSGRRVGGWVVAVGVDPAPGLALRAIAKVRGAGPEPELVELAGWGAWRWAGRRASFLKSASAGFAVPALSNPARRPPAPPGQGAEGSPSGPELARSLEPGRVTVLRLPPAADPTAVIAEIAQLGPTLVVLPSLARSAVLAGRLRRAGGDVALLPRQWSEARAGRAVVIGARAAAWGPCPGLAAAVVLDGHDEGLGQEQAPTWNAVDVLAERARRAGAPCVVASACPTPELLALGSLRTVDRAAERRGWAALEVIDRRADDPRLGLYSKRLVDLIRSEPRVVCVLNRTGRARLLACAACGELARCENCGAALSQETGGKGERILSCPRCGLERPQVCAGCSSSRVKLLRVGVTRAREELEALAGRPVAEVTAQTRVVPDARLLVGTEAVLHRLGPNDGVTAAAFVDFDQELLAGRVRAGPEALGLLAGASRLVRGRTGRVLVQTRMPDHPVIRSALLADPGVLAGAELEVRAALRLPPVTAVAVVSGQAAPEFVDRLREARPPVEILGPDRDRWLVKAADPDALARALAGTGRPAGALRVAVEPSRL